MKQRYFKVDKPPRYCNTHRDWIDDHTFCPENCCNGWKLRKALELCFTVESKVKH